MRTRLRIAFFALLVVAASAAGSHATVAPSLARLEVTITTTSPWTSVMLWPGRIVTQRVTAVPTDVTLTSAAQGWVVNSGVPGQVRTVTLRAVYEEPAQKPTIRVTVSKGSTGKTVADIRNTSNTSFQAAYVFNQLPMPSTGTPGTAPYSTYITKTRAQFFGAGDPTLPHADPRPLVLAAFYPWWHLSYSDAKLSDRPVEPRSTLEYPGVLAMTQQARTAGIDGFVVSWAGETFSGWRFDLALQAAEATGGTVTPYLEMLEVPAQANGKPDPAAVLDWMSAALSRSSSPAFLRSGGVPVMFVFTIWRMSPAAWNWVMGELVKRGTPVRLVGDAPLTTTYGALEWGVHQYSPNSMTPDELTNFNRSTMLDARLLATADPTGAHLVVASVSPGYDDTKLRGNVNPVVPRGAAGERYTATWDAAAAGDPDWVLVTSWNEWFEGTAVEPSVLYGDLALRQTAERSALFGS